MDQLKDFGWPLNELPPAILGAEAGMIPFLKFSCILLFKIRIKQSHRNEDRSEPKIRSKLTGKK
jgi:hypothetical protein